MPSKRGRSSRSSSRHGNVESDEPSSAMRYVAFAEEHIASAKRAHRQGNPLHVAAQLNQAAIWCEAAIRALPVERRRDIPTEFKFRRGGR